LLTLTEFNQIIAWTKNQQWKVPPSPPWTSRFNQLLYFQSAWRETWRKDPWVRW
jgi:hypothetical protein